MQSLAYMCNQKVDAVLLHMDDPEPGYQKRGTAALELFCEDFRDTLPVLLRITTCYFADYDYYQPEPLATWLVV